MVNLDMASWAVCVILTSVFARAVGVAAVQRTDFNGLLLHILGLCAHSSSAREPGGLYPERIPYHVRRLDLSCSIPPSAHSLFLSFIFLQLHFGPPQPRMVSAHLQASPAPRGYRSSCRPC